jgi:AcrR family transcriptional regulator
MSWSRHGGRPRGYHHGNLKEALIRAALELIAQKGPAGFTFAEAARWAGVSPAAPYRHLRDRDELLIDVARRGFDQFAVTLESAWDSGLQALAAKEGCGSLSRTFQIFQEGVAEFAVIPRNARGRTQARDDAF